jgi:hypothetical protein
MYGLLTAVFAIALTACGGNEESKDKETKKQKNGEKTEQTDKADQAKQMEEMKKKLAKQKVEEDKVVALVNDAEIKGTEYNRFLERYQMQYQQMGQDPTSKETAKQMKDQIINSLVDYEIVLQQAEKKGYEASEEKVDKQFNDFKGQFEDDKKYQEALKQYKLTEKELKQEIAESIKYTTYVEKEIKVDEVSEKQVKDYYNKLKESQGDKAPKYEEAKGHIKTQLEDQAKDKKLAEKVKVLKKDAEITVKI